MYATKPIPENAIVYSFGVGTDIEWDLEMIKQGATVYAFDPSPKSIKWLQTQDLPEKFIFTPCGLGSVDGLREFYPPPNPKNVSYSSVRKVGEPEMLSVARLDTIMLMHNHSHIDVLKMDIEGGEYDVLPSILGMDIDQILIEFHDRFSTFGFLKTFLARMRLQHAGYKEFARNGSDYSFSK